MLFVQHVLYESTPALHIHHAFIQAKILVQYIVPYKLLIDLEEWTCLYPGLVACCTPAWVPIALISDVKHYTEAEFLPMSSVDEGKL